MPLPGDFDKEHDLGLRMHTDHCIEALRLNLMCQSDTTPVFLITDPKASLGVRPDFSGHHKCRNFEKIRQWAAENEDKGMIPHHQRESADSD
jgi:hypothetical protein